MNLGDAALRNDRTATIPLAHELMHAVGISHVSPEFNTIMAADGSMYATQQYIPQPLSILYPVDREALRALYGHLDAGDSPDDLGD